MPLLVVVSLLLAGCAALSAPAIAPPEAPASLIVVAASADAGVEAQAPAAIPTAPPALIAAAPAPGEAAATPVAVAATNGAAVTNGAAAAPDAASVAAPTAEGMGAPDGADDDDDADDEPAGEGESHDVAPDATPGVHYTAELAKEELERMWKEKPASLGPMSVGFVDAGRLVNAVQFPAGPEWVVVSPERAWATDETIAYIQTAIRAVRAEYPNAPPLRVNQISAREGGYIRPHQSHQNGRDVDLGFYYPTVDPVRVRAREKVIDLPLNWALIKAITTQTDVQMILVDKRVQKRLYDFALAHGEDRAWVSSLFHGKDALLKHARGHRDHFHVRFFNPRAQELGRRVAPLLAQQPEYNVAMHRVRRGDNLGAIARKYGSSPAAIRKANHMKNNAIRAGITLSVPLRGACVHCPVPPAIVVPPRRVLPEPATIAAAHISSSREVGVAR